MSIKKSSLELFFSLSFLTLLCTEALGANRAPDEVSGDPSTKRFTSIMHPSDATLTTETRIKIASWIECLNQNPKKGLTPPQSVGELAEWEMSLGFTPQALDKMAQAVYEKKNETKDSTYCYKEFSSTEADPALYRQRIELVNKGPHTLVQVHYIFGIQGSLQHETLDYRGRTHWSSWDPNDSFAGELVLSQVLSLNVYDLTFSEGHAVNTTTPVQTARVKIIDTNVVPYSGLYIDDCALGNFWVIPANTPKRR